MARNDFLKKIVAEKRREVGRAKRLLPGGWIRTLVRRLPKREPFRLAKALGGGFGVICEVKKGSPSRGIISADFNAARTARLYERAGAAAISVLTDQEHFFGSAEDLVRAREAVRAPLLRKDFIVDEYQVYEAKLWGADIVLLIAAILPASKLRELMAAAKRLGLDVLLEVHSRTELEKVLPLRPAVIGVNNRDLRTFKVDLRTSLELRKFIPDSCFCVSESGIFSARDVRLLRDAGYDAVLVGEALMRSKDPATMIRGFKRS
jgi:indole-3-glycerol phosphate synthase